MPIPTAANHPTSPLFMSRTLGGRLKGTFDLGPELAAGIEAAMNEKAQELFHRDKRNRETDPTDPGVDRSAANRRAVALAELIEQGAADPDNPARRRPAFNVQTDLPTFAGEDAGLDALHELDNGQVTPLSLMERDRGCAVPGCDRRPTWCDSHHV